MSKIRTTFRAKMAIYSLHIGFASRSSGRSSVQSAAYICGEKLHEDRRDKIADYTKRASDVVLTNTLAPEHSKYKDLSAWNAVEKFEDEYADKHFKDETAKTNYKESAQTAQTIVLALPNEFSIETCAELLEKFINERFTNRGLITTYAIHDAEGNLHAHLQITRRAIGEDGEFLNRKDREICSKSAVLETRKLWADMTNEFLEREGIKDRVTEKSFKDLGLELEPTKHRGWYADRIGENSRIARENLKIAQNNEERLLQNPSIILDSLNATRAVFTQKDILREIGKRATDEKLVSAIFEKALESAEFVGENAKGELLYTGAKYRELEENTLTKFDELSAKTAKIVCEEQTISKILEKYSHLNDEQKKAVVGICGDRNFDILIGKAGAGKTTTTRAVAEIYRESGARVVGMSLSAVAAENLGDDAKIESKTIASWTHSWRAYEAAKEKFLSFESIVTDGVLKQLDWYNDLQRYEKSQLKSGDLIIVDEAGMVGTAEWNEILTAAARFGAKIAAVGDNDQFKAISAGDCLRRFIDSERSSVLELKEIRRQEIDWMKEASVEFSKLNVFEALAKYENNDRLLGTGDEEIVQAAAEKYWEFEKSGSAAVLCYRKSTCREINEAVREFKKERGELGEDIATIGGRSFSSGERIMFLENDKRFGVKNGETAVLESATLENGSARFFTVRFDDGRKTTIDVLEYDKADHAYAITTHKSQGKTFDRVVVVADKTMDASAAYVSMTRHRKDVVMLYRTSNFQDFKALANGLSKYRHKDLQADYRLSDNSNKAKVYEYKNSLLELAEVLKDINDGKSSWEEYRSLKEASVTLGKEIAANYGSHRLYLDQIGITKEKLEISVGLRQRPLTNVELSAKNTVELYAKSSKETREFYEKLKSETFNVTDRADYEKYSALRDSRNDLAREILQNYPLHREFVAQLAREYFISKKTMENQVAYAAKRREQDEKIAAFEPTARKEVAAYVDYNNRCRNLYEKMTAETRYIKSHSEYENYSQIRELRNERAQKILEDYPSYKKIVEAFREEYGISKTWMENQVSDADKIKSKGKTEAVAVSAEARFFQKLEAEKSDPIKKYAYEGSSVADRMVLDRRGFDYEAWYSDYKGKFGYAPFVSQSMLAAYSMERGLKTEFYNDSATKEYASMLAQRQADSQGVKEPTLKIAEDAIKQALCFKALYETGNVGELAAEKIRELHAKASILSERIANENIHVLNNKELMKEAVSAIDAKLAKETPLTEQNLNRLAELKLGDIDAARQSEIRKNKELEQSAKIEKSRGFEMGI